MCTSAIIYTLQALEIADLLTYVVGDMEGQESSPHAPTTDLTPRNK